MDNNYSNIDAVLSSDAFANVEPSRIALFKEMHARIAGLKPGGNPMEMMTVLMEYMPRLKQGGALEAAERDAMIDAICQTMDDREARKFRAIMQMAEGFGGA